MLFYAPDLAAANQLRQQIMSAPQNWKALAEASAGEIAIDSNRFDLSFIPNNSQTELKSGVITTPVVNKEDSTASFAYIIKLYSQPQQRSFTEAKGLVINDYQAQLEKEWIQQLRKKYPVVINQKVVGYSGKQKLEQEVKSYLKFYTNSFTTLTTMCGLPKV